MLFNSQRKSFWYNDLLLNAITNKLKRKEKNTIITIFGSPYVIFFLLALLSISGSIFLAFLTWDFDLNSYLRFLPFLIIVYSVFTIAYYILNKIIESYRILLLKFSSLGIIDENSRLDLENKLGLRYLRLIISLFLIGYNFLSLINDWIRFTTIKNPNAPFGTYPIWDYGFYGAFWVRITQLIFLLLTVPDVFAFTIGILFFNFKYLAKKVKLMPFNSDKTWGVSAVGRFVLMITRISIMLVILINLTLIYLLLTIKRTNIITADLWTKFLFIFWIFGPWLFVIFLFFIPQLSFRNEIQKYKIEKIAIYSNLLNKYESEIIENKTINNNIANNILALNEIKKTIESNSNWPFDLSTVRRMFSFTLAPIAVNIILILFNLIFQ